MEEIKKKRRGVVPFLFEYSGFLLLGSVIALIWANVDNDSYKAVFETELKSHASAVLPIGDAGHHGDDDKRHQAANKHDSDSSDHSDDDHPDDDHSDKDHPNDGHSGGDHAGGDHSEEHHGHPLNLKFIIDSVLMAFFFAIAGKEVWESMLPGGDLSEPRKAATPLMATVGGIIGPAGVYMAGVFLLNDWQLKDGWAIPCATDIAFSYLVARLIFGSGHPAISFLLLLAIADDAAGLVILAVFYPEGPIQYLWFLLTGAALVTAWAFHHVLKLKSFWWYILIPGVMCWFSFFEAGIHAALGLVPIIPFMPHAHSDLGVFAKEELKRHDTLNEFEHWWEKPVELILGLFGLAGAGVALSNFGNGTYLVLAGLLIGKPIGITLFTWLGGVLAGLKLPEGMNYRHIVTVGMIAGMGFTVALFVSGAAFKASKGFPPEVLDAAKMGALLSFAAGGIAFIMARLLGIKPLK